MVRQRVTPGACRINKWFLTQTNSCTALSSCEGLILGPGQDLPTLLDDRTGAAKSIRGQVGTRRSSRARTYRGERGRDMEGC